MRIEISNLRGMPLSLDLPTGEGDMIRELLQPIGKPDAMIDVGGRTTPYDLNRLSIVRQLNASGAIGIAIVAEAGDIVPVPGGGGGGGGYDQIQSAGVNITQRTTLDFRQGLSAVDSGGITRAQPVYGAAPNTVAQGNDARFPTTDEKAALAGTGGAPAAGNPYVTAARQVIAGAGLTGGGALSADPTLNVAANADGSIVVNANDIQVGVLANDAQHGARGGGTQHATAIAGGAAGFISGADQQKLDSVTAGAAVASVGAGVGLTNSGSATAPVLDVDSTLDANARVGASRNSGVVVGPRRTINFIEGANVTLTVADDAGDEEIDVTIAAAGGGGGTDTGLRAPVRAATAAALPAYTRIGSIITANANGALPAIDGVTLIANDRLLLKNGAAGADDGLYSVTAVGDGSNPFVLTRTTDADSDAETFEGLLVWVREGTANGLRVFVLQDFAGTVNTDAQVWGWSVPAATATTLGAVQLAGQLGGSAASPDVRGLRETSGPTLLTLGAWADGQELIRSGATAVGAARFVNPMTTSQDLIVGGVSGAPGRLGVGVDAQALRNLAGSLGYFYVIHPRYEVMLFDDCWSVSGGTGYLGWIDTVSGGTTALPATGADTNHPGIFQFTTGTGTTGRSARGLTATQWLLGAGEAYCEILARVPTLSDGTDTYTIRIGFHDGAGGGAPVDGLFMTYSSAINGGNVRGVAVASGVASNVDSALPVAANTWHRYAWRLNAAGTSVEFFFDDVSIGSTSSGIPGTGTQYCAMTLIIEKSAGTVSRTLDVDYVFFHKRVTR